MVLTLVDNDQDSLPRLVGFGQLGVGNVEDGADIVESVVELLGTNDSHSGGSLLNFGGEVGCHGEGVLRSLGLLVGWLLRLMQKECVEWVGREVTHTGQGHCRSRVYIFLVGALQAPDQPMKHDRIKQRAKSEDRYHFQLIIDVP